MVVAGGGWLVDMDLPITAGLQMAPITGECAELAAQLGEATGAAQQQSRHRLSPRNLQPLCSETQPTSPCCAAEGTGARQLGGPERH